MSLLTMLEEIIAPTKTYTIRSKKSVKDTFGPVEPVSITPVEVINTVRRPHYSEKVLCPGYRLRSFIYPITPEEMGETQE